jgi:hypothetical protein
MDSKSDVTLIIFRPDSAPRSSATRPSAPLTIDRPFRRKAVVHYVVALDAERVLDHLGGAVSVIAVVACSRRLVMLVLLADDLDGVLPGQISDDARGSIKTGQNMVWVRLWVDLQFPE